MNLRSVAMFALNVNVDGNSRQARVNGRSDCVGVLWRVVAWRAVLCCGVLWCGVRSVRSVLVVVVVLVVLVVLVVYSGQLVSLRVAEVEQLCEVKRMIGGIVNKTREDEREESKRERKKKKKREKETEREREALRVCIQHIPVCAFKMSPCVPATCPHEKNMWACCRYTRGTF